MSIFGNYELLPKEQKKKRNPLTPNFGPAPAAPAPQAPPPDQGDGGFFNSPLAGTLIQAGGAGLQAYGQHKDAEAQRAQSSGQFAANMGQRQLENSQQNKFQQSVGAANASPLGANQEFAQQQAMMAAILPGLRNVRSTPSDPGIAAAMGSRTGGLRLPEGGLDPAMIARLYGDEATQNSIAQREKQIGQINPHNPAFDMGTLYGNNADGSENAFSTDIRNSNQTAINAAMDDEARQREVIARALDNDIAGERQAAQKKQSGGGWLKKLGKIAAFAAPIIAAPFTGGASLAAIGAASGAAGGALSGGGLKGAALGGLMGGATAGMGGGAKATSLKAGLKTAGKNALGSAILGKR